MKKVILILSITGLLFSGYISYQKLFSQTCSFGESCPFFLGYPACYYGFVIYISLTLLSVLLLLKPLSEKRFLNKIILVSSLGVLFAGYLSFGELPLLLERGFSYYTFGLPTCLLGLIFYLAIFFVSLFAKIRKNQ